MRIAFLALIALSSLALTPAQQKQLDVKLTINGRSEHPTVYLNKRDIERARANREKHAWAKSAAEKLLAEADAWAAKSDEDLVKLLPGPSACYAYGFSGCPICGGTLAAWWGAGGVASLDDPGHIRCVNGHRLPDEAHPDPGDGWTNKDGKKFYWVGTYNSFVIDTITTALTRLVHAYALSGDANYAHKAAVLLDNLARIYPSSDKGSWDYPSDPPSGRFNRPWYQVARMLVLYANDYDILMMGDELNAPSSVAGMTRRQNIEKNLLLNGAKYCYDLSIKEPSLNNGEADYIRGAMVVGVAMGIPEYVKWSVDGPYGIRQMIANNIDRDGEYYETSTLYSDHARALYMDMAQIVGDYSDADHPDGIRLSRDPVFQMFNLLPATRLRCATHSPSMGDDAPDVKRVATTQPIERFDMFNLERLRVFADDDPALAAKLDQLIVAGGGEKWRENSPIAEWLLFHARELPADEHPTAKPIVHPLTDQPLDASDLISQKGLAILRSGEGRNARAATLRFGPTLNHGHLDEMNLNLYACGYEMTYDLGYLLGSTHTQVGWAHNTASHNVVLVDETPQLASGRAGGSIEDFYTGPGVTIVRANDPSCYEAQGVKRYERTIAMIDASKDASYLIDIFRVEGGKQHDYLFHGLGTGVETEGLQLGEERPGSLAGKEIDWASKIGSDGNVVVGKEYWNPPPGNGLGFLAKPRHAPTPAAGTWSATWTIDNAADHPAHMRLTMVPTGSASGHEVIRSDAPGIYPKFPRAGYVIDRRRGNSNLISTFAAVIEPFGKHRVVKRITPLADSDADALAVKIELTDGRADYVMWSAGKSRSWKDGGHVLGTDGRFAIVRCDASGLTELIATSATSIWFDDVNFTSSGDDRAAVERVDDAKNILYTKAKLPEGDALTGKLLYIENAAYSQASAYRIQSVRGGDAAMTAIRLMPTRLTLARGHLADDPPAGGKTLPNITPLEYAKSVRRMSSGFFRGKRVTSGDGKASAVIGDFAKDGTAMTVDSAEGFKAGDDLIIHDVWPGDMLRLPRPIHRSRSADGTWADDAAAR
jgi:hypothetical protein